MGIEILAKILQILAKIATILAKIQNGKGSEATPRRPRGVGAKVLGNRDKGLREAG
jgi:hypothetical protein